MSIELEIDMSDASEKQLLWRELQKLRGIHEFKIKKPRQQRSDLQNRLYWKVYVGALVTYLGEQGQPVTPNFVHHMYRGRFLPQSVVCPVTGEEIPGEPRSTTELDTKEFGEYLDNIQAFLAETFHIEIPSTPEDHHANN
jgi:hypothetical protein